MITDNEANVLYLADKLLVRHPEYYSGLVYALKELDVPVNLIKGTADIWARDYMPVQIAKEKFVQFVYDPDYLRARKWRSTISDVDAIIQEMGLTVEKSPIRLDGGNVVKGKNKVILCDKVFKENRDISQFKLIETLEQIFEVNQIIIIPTSTEDIIGHADGYVRFLDDKTVLVNDYRFVNAGFREQLLKALKSDGLQCLPIPYNPYHNRTYLDATGIYVNYLQMQQGIILPVFGLEEDHKVAEQFKQLFPNVLIRTLVSNAVAQAGGVLNCVTWNIKHY